MSLINQIWGLAVSRDEKKVVSGGVDGVVNVWRDATIEAKEELYEESEKQVRASMSNINPFILKSYFEGFIVCCSLKV